MSDNDCEHEGYCHGHIAPPEPPTWDFDWHDVLGIGISTFGVAVANIGSGLQMLGNEFYASARWRRARRREIEEQVRNDMTFMELTSGDIDSLRLLADGDLGDE